MRNFIRKEYEHLYDSNNEMTIKLRGKLDKFGAAVLFDWIDDELKSKLLEEAIALEGISNRYSHWYTPYNDSAQSSNRSISRNELRSKFSLAVTIYNQIPENTLVRQIYDSNSILEVVRSVSGNHELKQYNDGAAALNITYMNSGDSVGWHFDTCDLVAALVLQKPSNGGSLVFSSNNQSQYFSYDEHVHDVVTRSSVHSVAIPYSENCLIIFNGKNSIHRIKHVLGDKTRIVILMSFDKTNKSNVPESLKSSRYVALDRST